MWITKPVWDGQVEDFAPQVLAFSFYYGIDTALVSNQSAI